MQPHHILHFWFTELTPKQHFAKDAALDEAIRTSQFELLHKALIDHLDSYSHRHAISQVRTLRNYLIFLK